MSSNTSVTPGELALPHAGEASSRRGAFLITIDTEGDDLWSKPSEITATNAHALPRFQELCERYGLRPTYLVNWEMVQSPFFREFGMSVLERDTAEIGMHLHAWNSPPLVPLTADDFTFQPYLIEYPTEVMAEKVKVMTDALETTFGAKMVSHRAGRWGLDSRYVRLLIEAGYRVDCSVTPHRDWSKTMGDPGGNGGPDFRHFPDHAYLIDPKAIDRPGQSPLLELPMTIMRIHDSAPERAARRASRRIPYVRRFVFRSRPEYSWLRAVGQSDADLVRIIDLAAEQDRPYVEFMAHSSELMAGGSPWFQTDAQIDALYERLEMLFAASTTQWQGRTLKEYDAVIRASDSPGA